MPNLSPPVLAVSGPQVQVTGPTPERFSGGRLLYRDGFEGQIRKLASAPGATGVLVPGEAATQLGVRPGDRGALSLTGRSATTRVAGVYRERHRLPPTPYWCSLAERIYPPGFAEDPPPSLVLADRATFTAISRRLQGPRLDFAWDLRLEDGITLAEARDPVAADPAARQAVATPGGGMIPPEQAPAFNSPRVALLLVAAAGSYRVDRRRVEVARLAARGVGPLAIAAKAVLEMLVWVVLGGLLGWLAAIGLVRLRGPSDLLDPSATPAALACTGVAVAAGLALLGLAARKQLELAARLRGRVGFGEGAPPSPMGRPRPAEVDRLLAALGLVHRAGHRPEQLSGGEQQRLAFAAAVIGGPALVVADEPTAELDSEAGERLMQAVLGLRDQGTGLVLSSHDPDALAFADRVLQRADGELREGAS